MENPRRRKDLIETSEALSDLARVLGWPERALSLGGRLGLAFGARGEGGPRRTRAHYEPLQRVIAISKPSGPGTLAHEWFHALDHHAMLTAGGHGYASEQKSGLAAGTALVDLIAALSAYGAAFGNGALAGRSARLDRRRPRSKPYWSTMRELAARAFEAWVVDRLARLGVRNDYLVNFVPAEEWTGKTDLDQGYRCKRRACEFTSTTPRQRQRDFRRPPGPNRLRDTRSRNGRAARAGQPVMATATLLTAMLQGASARPPSIHPTYSRTPEPCARGSDKPQTGVRRNRARGAR